MKRFLCSVFSRPCTLDSCVPAISSLIVRPSLLGAEPTLMRRLVTLQLIILVPSLAGYRVHTLLCRGSGLPVHFLVSPANVHDAPFARPLLDIAVHLSHLRPRIIQMSAAYWGLRLIVWIHSSLGAVAVILWNPQRQKNRSCLPPTWTVDELGKCTSIERFFGRVFLFFRLQRPPLCGWSAIVSQVALTYTATIIVALAAQEAGRPDLIRSPKRVLAHTWEGFEF